MTVIWLQLERHAYAPGEVVRGTVTAHTAGFTRAIQVSLGYFEDTSSYREPALIVSQILFSGNTQVGQAFPFAMQLPADAKPNLDTGWGEIYWAVDAKSDQPGFDSNATQRFELSPAAAPS